MPKRRPQRPQSSDEPIFNVGDAVKQIIEQFHPGDLIPEKIMSELLMCSPPQDTDLFSDASRKLLTRLARFKRMTDVLLKEYNFLILPAPKGAAEFIRPEEQVDRALEEMRHDVSKRLRDATLRISCLQTNIGAVEQANAANYVDSLRRAINPNSRRLKRQLRPMTVTVEPATVDPSAPTVESTVIPMPPRKRQRLA